MIGFLISTDKDGFCPFGRIGVYIITIIKDGSCQRKLLAIALAFPLDLFTLGGYYYLFR